MGGGGGGAGSTTPIQSLEECENTSRDYERCRETNRLIRRELEQRKKERKKGGEKKKKMSLKGFPFDRLGSHYHTLAVVVTVMLRQYTA